MYAVEAQQMRVGFHGAEIVDGNHFDVDAARLDDRAQHIAADAAEAVDGDFNYHMKGLQKD